MHKIALMNTWFTVKSCYYVVLYLFWIILGWPVVTAFTVVGSLSKIGHSFLFWCFNKKIQNILSYFFFENIFSITNYPNAQWIESYYIRSSEFRKFLTPWWFRTCLAWSDNVKYKIRTYRATVCSTLPIVTIWQQVPGQNERKYVIHMYILEMSSSWNFPARASPSCEFSSSSEPELGHFDFRAETELKFFKP